MIIDNRKADQPASQSAKKEKILQDDYNTKISPVKEEDTTSRCQSACITKESEHLRRWPILRPSLHLKKTAILTRSH